MKTNRYLSFCMVVLTSALLAGMVSCKKEKGPSELRAVMNDFATSGQKAYIDQEQYSCFVVGEKVRVNNSTGTITALERNDRQCVISGVAQTTNYNAFYPADMIPANSDLSNGFANLTVTLPRVQVYETDGNGNQIIKNPMMAELTDANENKSTLHFRNLCALLKITVRTNKAFDSIRVTMSGKNLWGSGRISGNKINITSNGGSTVTLALPSGHHGSPAGEAFYIMVPEIPSGTVSCTVEVVNGTDPVKSFSKSASAYFAACQIHTLGNFTFNAPVFTVNSDGGKVVFAPGNLQWSYSAMGTTHAIQSIINYGNVYYNSYSGGTWRFAEHQYDYVGSDNVNVSANCSTWVDLFGWGASGFRDSKPYDIGTFPTINASLSATQNQYKGYDWGVLNSIYNPKTKTNDPYGTWRTLTKDEWDFLLNDRNGWTCSNVSVPIGSGRVYGLLIYPDGFAKPASINSELYSMSSSTNQVYPITKTEYDTLESHGCVFLPAAGDMLPSYQVQNGNNLGFYWTATNNGQKKAKYVKVNGTGGNPQIDGIERGVGYSVRLARDVK